jgi:SPP1 family predicted phage head-tail adaptor
MRSIVSVLRKQAGVDDYGQPSGGWEPVLAGVFAAKEPLLGNEYYTSNATQSKVEVKFRLYYTPGITSDMRVDDGTDVYEILSAVDVKSLGRELLLYCRRVDP